MIINTCYINVPPSQSPPLLSWPPPCDPLLSLPPCGRHESRLLDPHPLLLQLVTLYELGSYGCLVVVFLCQRSTLTPSVTFGCLALLCLLGILSLCPGGMDQLDNAGHHLLCQAIPLGMLRCARLGGEALLPGKVPPLGTVVGGSVVVDHL